MSRIVKAKWVTHTSKVFEPDFDKKAVIHEQSDDQSDEQLESGDQSSEPEDLEEEVEVVDHQLEAIKAANDFMRNTLKASQEIIENSKEEGFNKGYDEGYQLGFEVGTQKGLDEGMSQADHKIEEALAEIAELATMLQEERNNVAVRMEDEFLAVALEIAKKIMRYEITLDETIFTRIFNEVIHNDDMGVKVYLSEYQNALDLHINKSIIDKIKALSQKSKVVILKEDDQIIVETDQSVIDVSVPVQLQQIQKAIEEN
ncbi:Yae1 family protein [Eubacteriaceae bacterium ES2]|nr:Yae1 family protein [Eubacteriaceae bacterium ES2]